MYVLFDKIAQESGPIFEAKNDGVAIRNYKGFLSSKESLFDNEFELVKIGEIDKETNIITQNKSNNYIVGIDTKTEIEGDGDE